MAGFGGCIKLDKAGGGENKCRYIADIQNIAYIENLIVCCIETSLILI